MGVHLSLRHGEIMIAGCQPDSGNPTVRDERGAYGNVGLWWKEPIHYVIERELMVAFHLRFERAVFLPDDQGMYSRG